MQQATAPEDINTRRDRLLHVDDEPDFAETAAASLKKRTTDSALFGANAENAWNGSTS